MGGEEGKEKEGAEGNKGGKVRVNHNPKSVSFKKSKGNAR